MRGGRRCPDCDPALERLRPEGTDADYDLVLIDTPPGEPILQDLVFASSDYLIIPTRSDEASLDGLVVVAQRFAAARSVNPDLTLLGVALFGVRAGSTRLIMRVRSALQETLGGAAPVFATSIRYLESAAVDMRSRGLLPHELAQIHREDKSQRISRLRQGCQGRHRRCPVEPGFVGGRTGRRLCRPGPGGARPIASRDDAVRVEVAV